ncbi:MAG: type II toxin-antitoxin system HicB family antitoxin [Bacteroidota bacterium]|nr:type II toxin-antitoxin system HicB family antitoxin [Bacteroidota bacterium]
METYEDGKYPAICPAWQGCYPEGDTKEEALEMIKDAIKLHIEERIENGELLYQEVFSSQVQVAD